MMAQLGSDKLSSAQSTNGINDIAGVPLISTNNDFNASPLGIAARSQALYGIANAQFNLLPPDPSAEIADQQNPLPYWSFDNYSEGRIIPESYYDLTTGTWSVELNPTAGSAADYLTMKTRSYLLTDDNLALRQKAYLTMSKGTAYAGATQFNVVLSAEYFDVNGTSLSSYAIGTALDNGAMTSITGITTSGSAAISASAAYVDFTIQLNVTATVTSGVKVYLKSFFIQTSQAATGSFLLTEQFLANGTWTRPAGVEYVDVVAVAAGGGGTRGGADTVRNTVGNTLANGGAGGGSGRWAILRGIYVGDVADVSIGIGAGGAGVAGSAVTKAAASSTVVSISQGTATSGGATTFGSYLSVPGGGGGTTTTGGGAGGTVTANVYGTLDLAGTAGASSSGGAAAGASAAISSFSKGGPYTTVVAGGTAQNGKAGTVSGGISTTSSAGGLGGTAFGLSGSGASGARAQATSGTVVTPAVDGGTALSAGAGGGGGAAASVGTATATYTVTGGAGGTALANSGSGGGGGGAANIRITTTANYDASTINITAGAGGDGAAGFVTVIWVA